MAKTKKKSYLKSKIQVGSIHSKLNYDRLERVFHSDDISQHIKDRVYDIHRMKQKHLPQLNWSKSTFLLKPENEATIPNKYTLNPSQAQALLAETKTFTKEKYDLSLYKSCSLNDLHFNRTDLEWGTTDLRDFYSYHKICAADNIPKKWDYSTIVNRKAFILNDNKSKLYLKNSKQLNLKKYSNPQQREQQRIYMMRKYKDQNRKNYIQMLQKEKIEKRIGQHWKRSNLKLKPFSSEDKENMDRTIRESLETKYTTDLLQEYCKNHEKNNGKFSADSTINQRLIELMMNKRNKMYTTRQLLKIQERRKYDLYRKYFHNGTYDDTIGGWSCCMNCNPHSQGCQVRLINTATWQTVGV